MDVPRGSGAEPPRRLACRITMDRSDWIDPSRKMQAESKSDFTCPSCGHGQYELTGDTFHGEPVYNCIGCGFPFVDLSSYSGRNRKPLIPPREG